MSVKYATHNWSKALMAFFFCRHFWRGRREQHALKCEVVFSCESLPPLLSPLQSRKSTLPWESWLQQSLITALTLLPSCPHSFLLFLPLSSSSSPSSSSFVSRILSCLSSDTRWLFFLFDTLFEIFKHISSQRYGQDKMFSSQTIT